MEFDLFFVYLKDERIRFDNRRQRLGWTALV